MQLFRSRTESSFFDNGLSLLYTELVDLISLFYQVQLTGNVGKYVTQVGAYNYYLLYDVMIQPYNDLGQGPNSSVSTIYSAEESKSQTEHNDFVSVILNMKNKITSNNVVLLLVIHQQHSIRKLGAKSRLRFSFAIPVSYSYLLPICLCDRMGCLFLLVPSISITNVQAYPYNATALMVTWDPVPDTREVMKGKLLGYQVKNEPSLIAL